MKTDKPLSAQIILLCLLIMGIGILALIFNNSSSVKKKGSGLPEAVTPINERALGPTTAKVVITEYSDFGCITCKAWHDFGIREKIIEKFGDDVRFVWRDFPVITANSKLAAEAGFCAHDQEVFWKYHDIVFGNSPNLDAENLISYAGMAGMNTIIFQGCLESGVHAERVEKEVQNALNLGLRGTPSFFVNNQPLIGPPSFEQLSEIITTFLDQ